MGQEEDKLRTVWLFFICMLILSCSPRYKVEKIYIPPKGKEKCVENCRDRLDTCLKTCDRKYESCLKEAVKQAKEIYEKQLRLYKENYKRYLSLYETYLKDIDKWLKAYKEAQINYEYYRKKCVVDKSFCSEKEVYKRILEKLKEIKPEKPSKPEKPVYSDILETQKRLCDKSCQCRENFDICFQSYGGKILIKRICVENCE